MRTTIKDIEEDLRFTPKDEWCDYEGTLSMEEAIKRVKDLPDINVELEWDNDCLYMEVERDLLCSKKEFSLNVKITLQGNRDIINASYLNPTEGTESVDVIVEIIDVELHGYFFYCAPNVEECLCKLISESVNF